MHEGNQPLVVTCVSLVIDFSFNGEPFTCVFCSSFFHVVFGMSYSFHCVMADLVIYSFPLLE